MEIEERLERIERKLDQLLAKMGNGASAGAAASGGSRGAAPPASAGGEIATDADLDSTRGNPEVRFSPKRWSGADMKGRRYSECEPEFLDMLAETLDWFASKDDEANAVDKNGNPKSKWGRLDASRARGWSRRLRADRGESVPARGGMSAGSRGAAPMGGGGGGMRAAAPPARKPAPMDDFGGMDDPDGESIPF